MSCTIICLLYFWSEVGWMKWCCSPGCGNSVCNSTEPGIGQVAAGVCSFGISAGQWEGFQFFIFLWQDDVAFEELAKSLTGVWKLPIYVHTKWKCDKLNTRYQCASLVPSISTHLKSGSLLWVSVAVKENNKYTVLRFRCPDIFSGKDRKNTQSAAWENMKTCEGMEKLPPSNLCFCTTCFLRSSLISHFSLFISVVRPHSVTQRSSKVIQCWRLNYGVCEGPEKSREQLHFTGAH